MIKKLPPDIKARWLTALRSGEYKQGKNRLRNTQSDGKFVYCCLGVLCDVLKEDVGVQWQFGMFDGSIGMLPNKITSLIDNDPDIKVNYNGRLHGLSELNDTFGLHLDDIANIIEEQL